MKVHNVAQGSKQWTDLRIGKPTSSGFSRILTPKTRKPAAAAEKYAFELLSEWAFGVPSDMGSSQWMERGIGAEPQAVAFYEWERDCKVDRPGFVTTDDERIGCSPDFLCGADGGGEIKTLSAVNHLAAIFGATDDEYTMQVMGCLWITGRAWWDRVWWNPSLPSIIVRVYRDEELIKQLADAVTAFADRLDTMKEKLAAMGFRKPKPPGPRVDPYGDKPLSEMIPTAPPMTEAELDRNVENIGL